MSFADEVEAATEPLARSVGQVVLALNVLTKKDRAEIVAFIDAMPAGTQKNAVARAIYVKAKRRGYDGVELTSGHLATFVQGKEGGRHGLLP